MPMTNTAARRGPWRPSQRSMQTTGPGIAAMSDTEPQIALIADGMSEDDMCCVISDLEREDIREALCYAAEAVCGREWPLLIGE